MAFLQTPTQMEWYNTLFHSSLTPPPIIFSIVWTILYALIAISAELIWEKGGRSIFFAQLILQIVWSYTFFVAHALWMGFFVLLLLSITVGLMCLIFAKHSKLAGLLVIPYFIWCLFASYLNLISALLN
ncbi:MAG: tryptophan-rich sensory protein [Alphaproteobacteria bacterium]|nr:tryptophan-rich sensory protein [Alphaproteobacteria bacterium]